MNSTRRKFIRNTIITASGAGLVTAFPGSAKAIKSISANDKVIVGLIGCNGMGFANLQAFLKQPGVECAALCDVDHNVLEKEQLRL